MFVSFLGIGQNSLADSLLTSLQSAKDDTDKVNKLNQISLEFENQTDYIKAKVYSMQAINLAKRLTYKKGEALANKRIGNIYFDQGDYSKAIEFYYNTLKIYEEIKDKKGISSINTNIGNTYSCQKDDQKAIAYFNKSIKGLDELKMQKSTQYFNALIGIGTAYEHLSNFDKAIEFYSKCQIIAAETNDLEGAAISYNNIGNIYKEQRKQYKEALDYYFKSLKIREEIGDKYFIATSCNNIGSIYLIQNKNKEALYYCSKSLALAKEIEALDLVIDAEFYLSSIYENMGNKAQALTHYKEFITARDSVFSAEKIKNIASQESKIKEEQMEAGFKETQIKKEAELKQQKIISMAFTVGFALVLILIVVVFRSLKQSRDKNKIIESQKIEVEHKQKEIVDSITYAQRIQHALLASTEMLNKNLGEYFVLFKPKDIVSGDFYWATKTDDAFYLVTADSTGHGVPGAFMSLLNISFLNEAINEKKHKDAGQILNHVRENLIKALKTDGSEDGGKDGMDCIITAFNFTDSTLQYAAANNSFYIIRDKELLNYKADKMPVGKSPRDNESFTSHNLQLQKGDIIYTLTDGYPDQFGGPKGKKFKYKPLEEILLANSHLNMEQQKEILFKNFEEWKGDLEQVDDVLIIGIKI